MNLLFVCSQNLHRSPTAERIFDKRDGYTARSAGLLCDIGGGTPLTRDLVEWADIVFVMEEWQAEAVRDRFPEASSEKEVASLEIPDIFRRNDPRLVELIKERTKKWLE